MIWTPKHDKILIECIKARMSAAGAATRITKLTGDTVTYNSVCRRAQQLRRFGVVEVPPFPGRTEAIDSPNNTKARAAELQKLLDEKNASRATTSFDGEDDNPAINFNDDDSFAPQGDATNENAVLRIVELTRRHALSFEKICDAIDMSPSRTRELIATAQAQGYRIHIEGAHVGVPPQASPLEEQTVTIAAAGPAHIIAVVGDVHKGSKYHMRAQFEDFFNIAYERGARDFLQPGDMLDGNYNHSVWEQTHRGFDEQCQLAIRELPQREGVRWHFIQGNHDETLGEKAGLDVGRAMVQAFREAGRHDLHYYGARGAYLRLKAEGENRGLLVELWHPRDKANAYALTYRLQKKVEKYAPGQKPDVLIAGHWHTTVYVPIRGVHAISAGCWQGGQSSFGKSLGGAPSIGSWLIEYALTEGGTVRRFAQEWLSYPEVETIREVGLG